MTTNCIQTPRESYRGRIFTTGMVGFAGVAHIAERAPGGQKDFSRLIELAEACQPPLELETGSDPGRLRPQGRARQRPTRSCLRPCRAGRSSASW